jgi:hypothetical protein
MLILANGLRANGGEPIRASPIRRSTHAFDSTRILWKISGN